MGNIFEFFGYAQWWMLFKLGKDVPLVDTIGIHYGCNLRCKHCGIADAVEANPKAETSLSYDQIIKDLKEMHKKGAKIAYFEGGEPTMWKDGEKDLGDLIDAAKDMGYYNIGYTTNGTTGTVFTNSDVISISLDGPKEIHDSIRGEGVFDKLMKTIDDLDFDGKIYANAVLQKDNIMYIREMAETVVQHPNIAGIVFNFITPPPYSIMPSFEERSAAIAEIKELKKEGFPILNSNKGLELLIHEDWDLKCPRKMSAFMLPGEIHMNGCPMTGTESCKHCGYAAVREYYLIGRGNPSTILEMSSVFAASKSSSDRH